QHASQRARRRAEIDRTLEAAQHRAEPLAELAGDAVEEERRRIARRAALAQAQQAAVEQLWACHGGAVSCRFPVVLSLQHERADFGKRARSAVGAGPYRRRLARRVAATVGRCAAAALPILPRAFGRRRRALCRLLVEAVADRAALLRPAWHSLHLRSRARLALDGGDRQSAELRAGARGGPLRRYRPRPGAPLQIRRPARSRTDDGALDGARRARTARGRRRAHPGAAALAQIMGAALQPVGRARRRDFQARRTAGAARRRAARTRDAAASRPQQDGAGGKRAGRVQGRPRPQGGDRRQAAGGGGRRSDLGGDHRSLRPRLAARRRRPRRRAGFRPGCCAGAHSHITRAEPGPGNAARRDLYHPFLPLLPRGQAAADAQRCRLQRSRRWARLAAPRGDDRARAWRHDCSPDLHWRTACRRQRRTARARTRRQARRPARGRRARAEGMNAGTFKAAMIQMRSGLAPAANIEAAVRMIGEAKSAGADYVQTPEMTNILAARREQLFAAIVEEQSDAALAALRELARRLGIYIHVGSLAIKISPERAA